MKNNILILLLLFCIKTYSQKEDAWVFLKDKPDSSRFLENPNLMLSELSLQRRSIHGIDIDEKDVPVHASYYNDLKDDREINVLGKSKWLNAIHVQGTIEQINNLLTNYTFIESIEFANKSLNVSTKKRTKKIIPNHQNKFSKAKSDFTYGNTENQIKMMEGDYLHSQESLTGREQIIAIIDAGFPNVNTLPAFQRIRDNNQILGGYNFADRNSDFYSRNSHGTHVLSTIAGYIENEFVGAAPDAKFYLFISEIAETETVLEETLWVEAAERADSLGVDIINTSLGYTTYDNPDHSHSYEDMDGKTTFITRGAEIGASRGMILVNSAGNSGNESWKYIGAPADAPSVISVGAVNSNKSISSFSSFGPTADGRIKPEITAQGGAVWVVNFSSGVPVTSSGTSFSSPIMAGLIACVNGITNNTTKSKAKKSFYIPLLKESIYQSSDKYNTPTDQQGYGIPDFEKAFNLYYPQVVSVNNFGLANINIYPNPVKNEFTISDLSITGGDSSLQIFNVSGKKVLEKTNLISNKVDVSDLENGIYLVKIRIDNQSKVLKLIKN
jgi:subtilisin family serine protease